MANSPRSGLFPVPAIHVARQVDAHQGAAPSVRELADHFHYRSPSMARRLLIGLEERGFVRRLPGKDRAIEVVKPVSRFAIYRSTSRLSRWVGVTEEAPNVSLADEVAAFFRAVDERGGNGADFRSLSIASEVSFC